MLIESAGVQVKQLFGFCGQVKSCRMVGNNQFAFVEYASSGVICLLCSLIVYCPGACQLLVIA